MPRITTYNIDKVPISQLLKDLVKRCWGADPAKRPTAQELYRTLGNREIEIHNKKDTSFYQQYQKIEEEYDHFFKSTPYRIHPTTIVTSRILNKSPNY